MKKNVQNAQDLRNLAKQVIVKKTEEKSVEFALRTGIKAGGEAVR